MRRIVVLAVLALAVAAPAAQAAIGTGIAAQDASGVVARDGATRYVTLGAGADTLVEKLAPDRTVLRQRVLAGVYGTPLVTADGQGGGLSHDGRTLVLQDVTTYPAPPTTRFPVLDARTLRVRQVVRLRGSFGYDALSPDGSRLFLVQHVDGQDTTRYVVRAYDLRAGRLLPGRIADRTQRSWVMQGMPVSRATSDDGRWVYTLYLNPGGFPFVHALDTVRGVAHCTGIPWRGADSAVWNMRLALRDGGRTLAVHWASGRRYLAFDTRSWRGAADRAPAVPWLWFGAAAGLATLLGLAVLRGRRRPEPLVPEEGPRVLVRS